MPLVARAGGVKIEVSPLPSAKGGNVMSITVEAVYENGVLRPVEPLPLKEQETVRLTIQTGETPLLRAYGIMGWTGSAELAELFATDPDLEYGPWGEP